MFYVFFLALAAVPAAVAQSANANCTDIPTYNWVFNSKSQSPCLVAEDLATVCDRNGFTLYPLSPGGSYGGPSEDQNNNCHCTSVFYSLISACAACQDGSWIPWTQYIQNCSTQVFLTVYPANIPSYTSVPHWAYLNVSASNNSFNLDAASSASGPESISPGSATAGAGTTGSTSTSKSSSHSKASPGTIAGAVVGSIIGASIIVGGILYWLNKKRKAAKRKAARMSETSEGPLYGTSPPPFPPSTTSPPPPTISTTLHSPDQPMVLYDPDNPATYPKMGSAYQSSASRPDLRHEYPGFAEPS